MPYELRWQPDDIERHRSMSATQFRLQMSLYQEFNLNRFLINRLPDGGSFNVKQDLVDTARKMIDGILQLCANRDKLTNHSTNFVWAVISRPRVVLVEAKSLSRSSTMEFHQLQY